MNEQHLPPTWVVIPTYWGPRHGSPFDHPTPLDGESTLPRLLESLTRQLDAPPFSVLILAASVNADHAEHASRRLREIGVSYKAAFPLTVADRRTLAAVSQILWQRGLDPAGVDLASYAGVRNLQLLIPVALGAQLIIALDDDEVVAPMHVARAHQSSNILAKSGVPFGIAGPYLNSSGSPFLPEASAPLHMFDQKSALMNQTLRDMMESDEPFPISPMALGGNMVFPRSLFEKIGFDPGITRGEDIDYLINARLAGFVFHFDKLLAIEHLPPRHYESSAYGKLRHDVYRFIYEREKLLLAGMAPDTFDPYPGRLLREDILGHASRALNTTFPADDFARWGQPDSVLQAAQDHAASHTAEYFEFARRWATLMQVLALPESSSAVRAGLLL